MSHKNRVDYFVRYCVDCEEVWTLTDKDGNWLIFTDSDGDRNFPLWPHRDLANRCQFAKHREIGALPRSMHLSVFLEQCVADMQKDGVSFGVFYDNNESGYLLVPDVLKKAIEDEIEFHGY